MLQLHDPEIPLCMLSDFGSVLIFSDQLPSAATSQFSTPNKPLPIIPTLSSSSGENDIMLLPSEDSGLACMIASSDTTKRDYALLELLDSERTYASDLILIRNYQIPLASGVSLDPRRTNSMWGS